MAGPRYSVRTRGGNVMQGVSGAVRTSVFLRNGPELARKLAALEKGMRDAVLAEATAAGAKVLADAWRDRVPIDEGHYRDAIEHKAKAGKRGATGLVQVGKAPGVPDDEQPRLYAARLEFGSARATKATLTAGRTDFASRSRRAQPSLRPAFDACKGEMVDTMSDTLHDLIYRAV